MRLAALLVLLAACQRLLDLPPVHLTDASGAFDDSRAPDAPVVGDASAGDGLPSMLVQEVSSSAQSQFIQVSLAKMPAGSDMLIAIGGSENGVKDIYGAGAVWKLAASSIVSPTIQIWYGVTDGSSKSVTLDGNGGKIWVEVSEWRGLAPLNTFDAGSGSGAIVGVGAGDVNLAVTTQSAPDLLVFGIACYGTIGTPPAAWTALDGVTASFVTQDAWYQLQPAAGLQTAGTTYDGDYDAALAAFRTMP